MRSSVRSGPAALLVAVVLCGVSTGCGIRPTGVVDAGEPARGPIPEATEAIGDGVVRPTKPGAELYFAAGDTVQAVFRPGLPPGDPDVALGYLLRGPTPEELKSGYTTDLPPELTALQLGRRSLDTVTVSMNLDPNQLSSLAILQITCTIAYTVPSDSLITLSSPNGEIVDTKPCPNFTQDAPTSRPLPSPSAGG